MTMTLKTRNCCLALVLLAAAAPGGTAAADGPQPDPIPTPPAAVVQTPETVPPVVTRRTVSARVAPETTPAGLTAGDLGGLRAVSLREGAADVSLDGVARKLKVGDALGAGTVRAIGSDRISLERPFAVPGGPASRATVIVTFGKGGLPRLRTIVDVGAVPRPELFEESR